MCNGDDAGALARAGRGGGGAPPARRDGGRDAADPRGGGSVGVIARSWRSAKGSRSSERRRARTRSSRRSSERRQSAKATTGRQTSAGRRRTASMRLRCGGQGGLEDAITLPGGSERCISWRRARGGTRRSVSAGTPIGLDCGRDRHALRAAARGECDRSSRSRWSAQPKRTGCSRGGQIHDRVLL